MNTARPPSRARVVKRSYIHTYMLFLTSQVTLEPTIEGNECKCVTNQVPRDYSRLIHRSVPHTRVRTDDILSVLYLDL